MANLIGLGLQLLTVLGMASFLMIASRLRDESFVKFCFAIKLSCPHAFFSERQGFYQHILDFPCMANMAITMTLRTIHLTQGMCLNSLNGFSEIWRIFSAVAILKGEESAAKLWRLNLGLKALDV